MFFILQFDVTFPAIPCTLLSLDAMDISGEQHRDIVCNATYGCYMKCCFSLTIQFLFILVHLIVSVFSSFIGLVAFTDS